MVKRFLVLILVICPLLVSAQYTILENNPPRFKWYQINTPHFDLIFNWGYRSQAVQMANRMETNYEPVSESLNITPKKISLILQNHNVVSNGFVSQTPRRSEFYTMPSQDYNYTGVLNWLDLLSIHEFRHVVQFDKSRIGFNNLIHFLFGFEASASMAHIAVPEWFWEGDAVNMETALSRGGRGRIPNFSILMRANTLERKTFNYHRQYLGSYRYNTPNHYILGHFFTAYLRRKYGGEVIDNITRTTWSWPFLPFRFSGRMKKYTGNGLIRNYQQMMNELDSLWKRQIDQRKIMEFSCINIRKNGIYTDYLYPDFLNDGRILVMKQGFDHITTFVALDSSGGEEKIFVPGQVIRTGDISVKNNRIVWNEYTYDPRYSKVVYSDIRMYDLYEHRLYRITKKSRFGSAALSPDGEEVVTVETQNDGRHFLVILDAHTGKEARRFSNPENIFFEQPSFSDDGKKIVVIQQGRAGKTISIIDIETGKQRNLWPETYENVGHPVLNGRYVLFNSGVDGIDNVYAFDIISENRYRVTSSKFGAYNARISWDQTKIIFNNFSKDGQDVVIMDFKPDTWEPIVDMEPVDDLYVEALAAQEGNKNIIGGNTSDVDYPVSRYYQYKHLMNIYGWGPYITSLDPEFLIGVRSQDILSSTLIDLGYAYNLPENTGRWQAGISYQRYFPILNANGYTGQRSTDDQFIVVDKATGAERDTTVHIEWKETGAAAGFLIPLNLTRSKYYQNLNIGFSYSYNLIRDYNFSARHADQQANGNLFSNTYFLQYRRLLKISKRDIRSKFGQLLSLNYQHTPYGGDYRGGLFAAQVGLIFPGLARHHSIYLKSDFLYQDIDQGDNIYLFRNPVTFTRGYSYLYYRAYMNNSFNYALPLVYPDMNIASLLYIQRIYTNLFLDVGSRYLENSWNYYRSVGLELSFDFNLMRYLTRFNMGIRYSYALDESFSPGSLQIIIGNIGF